MTIQEKVAALTAKNINVPFGASEENVNTLYNSNFANESEVYKAYKNGNIARGGNAKSLNSATMFRKFGVSSTDELFDLLDGKEIKANLKKCSLVSLSDVPNVPKTVKAGKGVHYSIDCSVTIGSEAVTFEVEAKTLATTFTDALLETTKGVLGSVLNVGVNNYNIQERTVLGLRVL